VSIDFDFSELHEFVVKIDQADEKVAANVKKAVGISALKGKRVWQAEAAGHRYSGRYPASIDYDPVDSALSTDLGPNFNRSSGAAGLGIVEDSPGGVRGTPQRNYEKAEKVIEQDLVIGVLKAVDDSIGGV
jgi:hypothetical protein